MECHKADALMMKYMDNILSEDEAARLGEHLTTCQACRADFQLYDSILSGFSKMEIIAAPDDFEECVMRKIMELPALRACSAAADNMMCLIWGLFSVLFGLGTLAALNRDAIMAYVATVPELAAYTSALTLVSEYVTAFSASLSLVLDQILTSTAGYISASRYVLIGLLAVLAGLQVFIHRRSGVKANAE